MRAFAFFGGVPAEAWYDNPKTAVTKILAGHRRQEHESFSSLRAHYLFDSSFCNPASGNEKGSVENLVGYARRNALVPYDRDFASMDDLDAHLLAWCERERTRHAEAWEIESAALSALPGTPFSARISRPVAVTKTSMVRVDGVRYSVPVAFVGRRLRSETSVARVEVYDGARRVAVHIRSYLRGDSVLELSHYLGAFERKPRSALSCAALSSADPVFTLARDIAVRTPDGHRSFAAVLLLAREIGLPALAKALELVIETAGPVTPEYVRQLALNVGHRRPAPVAVPMPLAMTVTPADLSVYDRLAVGA